ncbi:Fatty acyl-AMP ligase FadD28 and polyketide synthase [Mycobacteroides abscessus]|nr:Fatty acyl-AMP ligase FadD28 and polyketide synthase [Mycobacteroides abscessus]
MNVIIQVTWLYAHAIDLDALQRFRHNLGRGLLGRRIEAPALPIARHRWVIDHGPADIDIEQRARPRAEFSEWVDERSQLHIDPESGPGWHIGVLPLQDGTTAISLVLSHNLIDGLGLALVIVEAVLGRTRDLGYPLPLSRRRLRALGQDARQTARDVPQVARALVAAVKLGRKQARDKDLLGLTPAAVPLAGSTALSDEVVLVPAITIYVDLDAWDARAEALGGASHTLAAAFAARFGERIGRRRAHDGAITLQIPISDRTENDTRAMALSYARVSIDPVSLTTDLREVRAAIKQTLKTLKESPDESKQLLWLPSFTPKRTLKRMVARMPADPDQSVFCSYLGPAFHDRPARGNAR